jgi:hypothetical protein
MELHLIVQRDQVGTSVFEESTDDRVFTFQVTRSARTIADSANQSLLNRRHDTFDCGIYRAAGGSTLPFPSRVRRVGWMTALLAVMTWPLTLMRTFPVRRIPPASNVALSA